MSPALKTNIPTMTLSSAKIAIRVAAAALVRSLPIALAALPTQD